MTPTTPARYIALERELAALGKLGRYLADEAAKRLARAERTDDDVPDLDRDERAVGQFEVGVGGVDADDFDRDDVADGGLANDLGLGKRLESEPQGRRSDEYLGHGG